MLNSIQTTETPTPEPEQAPGYSAIGESDNEYEGSSDSSESDDDSSASEGGYVVDNVYNMPIEPAATPQVEPATVSPTLSDVKPYSYDGSAAQSTSVADSSEIGAGSVDQLAKLEKQQEMMKQERRMPLTKKKSSKFFDSFKAGVRSAFSFWKSKDKKSEKQGKFSRALHYLTQI